MSKEISVEAGWTPLEMYAYVLRTLGVPAKSRFDGRNWSYEGPFTPLAPEKVKELLAPTTPPTTKTGISDAS